MSLNTDRHSTAGAVERVNLFAFYHNHRRYKSGKRKAKTPMEILTKEENQEDWLKLLSQFISSKDSNFFI